jgi:hypothetical protein
MHFLNFTQKTSVLKELRSEGKIKYTYWYVKGNTSHDLEVLQIILEGSIVAMPGNHIKWRMVLKEK